MLDLCPSGILGGVDGLLLADVSGQTIGPFVKCLVVLDLENETDRLSRNASK